MNSITSIRSKRALVQYVYTLGVMVTGVVIGDQLGGFDSAPLWVALLVVALAWIVYYQFFVVPRLDGLVDERREAFDEGR